MAQSIPPVPQVQFGGVVTAGHPLNRPRGSAIRCRDFRPMPGNWLRLRGGRTLRSAAVSGSYRQFYEFRKSDAAGGIYHLAQHTLSGVMRLGVLDLTTYGVGFIATIDQRYGLADPNLVPITTVRDRVFFANGLGVRDTTSTPPLSSWDGTTVRYVGLDAYFVQPSPPLQQLSFTPGAGYNTVQTRVKIYVGLYNSTTGHFSNGVYYGEVLSTGGFGTINVLNMPLIKTAWNNATELAELFYVFYATIDGGQVPYLILNAALDGPEKVAIGTSSTTLSIADATTNGWNLDLTQEMPTENFPPRPMSQIACVNGRIYGAPMVGGYGTAYRDFQYTVTNKEVAAIVWSAAIDDSIDTSFCGNPEEAWPLRNKKYTPNGERPLLVAPAPGGSQVLVVTKTATFILKETVDGLHEWDTISDVQGILNVKTFVNTPRGPMWMDQFKQIVRLVPSTFQLEVVSSQYTELLTWPDYAAIGQCAAYLLDPANQIDRYQVWRADGSSVIHDFWIGGQAYETLATGGEIYTAAATLMDSSGRRYNLVASASIFTQEADPVTGYTPTRDQNADGTYLEIVGDWIGQWDAFGDSDNRKEFTELAVVGDAAHSNLWSGSPLTLTWYGDLSSDSNVVELFKTAQGGNPLQTDLTYKGKIKSGHLVWLKHRVQLAGHAADGFLVYTAGAGSMIGDLPVLPYGSVFEIRTTVRLDPANRQ